MYIKQVIENRESWWGYILTVILIVPIAVFLFSIPHGIILTSKAFGNEELMAKIASCLLRYEWYVFDGTT